MSTLGESVCEYLVDTDVAITLFVAEEHGLAHEVRAWFRRHGRRACYSELLRDELHDMEKRGKLCPGDAQRIIDTMRRYGVNEVPGDVGRLRRSAVALLLRKGLSIRLRNDASLALHAAERRLRLLSYNILDFIVLGKHIRGLLHVKSPGDPLAYSCQKGG